MLVVFGHVARGIANAGITSPHYAHATIDQLLYSFHMPLFFFLSGIVFLPSLNKYGRLQTILRKVDSLLYPYLVWSLIQGSVEVLLSRYTNNSLDFHGVLSHLLVPRAQFWFLYALFFVSIAATLLYWSNQRWNRYLVLLGSVLIFQNNQFAVGIPPLLYVSRYLVYFAIGVSFANFITDHRRHTTIMMLCSGAFLILVHAFAANGFAETFAGYPEQGFVDSQGFRLIMAVVAIVFVLGVSTTISGGFGGAVARMGQASLAIYLMHILTGSGVRILLQHALGVHDFWTHLIVGTTAGTLLPMVALYAINRWQLHFLLQPPAWLRVAG